MTNNQTIDGVSGALLKAVIGHPFEISRYNGEDPQ